jgi:hypothetical protein
MECETDAVWILWHSYELDGEEESTLIGVYSTEAHANASRERASKLPGFRDHPAAFIVDRYKLDEDNWTEGFVTVRQSPEPPPRPGNSN